MWCQNCRVNIEGGGPNWFSKSAVASTSSNVTPFTAVGRASPPPPLPPPLDSPRKLLNMTDLFFCIRGWALEAVPSSPSPTKENPGRLDLDRR